MKRLNATKILLTTIVLFYSVVSSASLYNTDRQEFVIKNILKEKNPGFENGRAAWTASGGTVTAISSGSSLLTGSGSVTWDSNAAAQTFSSSSVAIPNGLLGTNGVAFCKIKSAGGTATHNLEVTDGTNVIGSSAVVSSATPTYTYSSFIFPSSGNIILRLSSVASNEPSIAIDDCYIGENVLLNNVSQASLFGKIVITGCTWSRSNAVIGDLTAGGTCSYALEGNAVSPGSNIPGIKFNSLPPGKYLFLARSSFDKTVTTTNSTVQFRFTDGTASFGGVTTFLAATIDGVSLSVPEISGSTSFSSAQTSPTFKLQCSTSNTASATACGINQASSSGLDIEVYRFPIESEQVYKPDVSGWKIDANIASTDASDITLGTSDQTSYITPNNANLLLTQNTGSESVGISCSSTNDNTVGATTCPAGNEEPGIIFNLPRAGIVRVCFAVAHYVKTGASGVVNAAFQVVSTANGSQTVGIEGNTRINSGTLNANNDVILPAYICGQFQFPSSGKKTVRLMYEQDVTATVTNNQLVANASTTIGQRDIHVVADYVDQNTANPVLTNSVYTPNDGPVRLESGTVSNNGSVCAISSNIGSWNTPVRAGTGQCTFNFGTAFSVAPTCVCIPVSASATEADCNENSGSLSTTGWGFRTHNNNALADLTARIICMGPK